MAGIYIHIPFCRQKCHYCNFYSLASRKLQQGFVPALLKEIELRSNYLEGETIETVYFGGGTPSLLEPGLLGMMLEKIRQQFNLSADAEITLEANPDDIEPGSAASFLQLGINRLSLGVQSFDDRDLNYLFRTHSAAKARRAIELLIAGGLNNLSIDLIYGVPTMNLSTWSKNLETVLHYEIQHLSAYWLTVEPGTALEKMISGNSLPAPDDNKGILQFRHLQSWASSHDYIQYEISNFGKSGFFSRHNLSYWQGEKYLGLGPSAHSYDGKNRQWNISSLGVYKDSLNEGIIPYEMELVTPLIRYEEMIMTGIRTCWGIDLQKLSEICGIKAKDDCLRLAVPHLEAGNLILDNNSLRLSNKGYLIADRITADLFMVNEGEADLL